MVNNKGPDDDPSTDALNDMGGEDSAAPIEKRSAPQSARPARPDRPSMPTSTGWERAMREPTDDATPTQADFLGVVSDVDDDVVIAPAPDPQALSHVAAASVARPRRHLRQMTTQRTLIPILLTIGALLIITGSLRFVAGEDAAIGGLPSSLSLALMIGGALVLGTGVLNMFYVRAVLAAHGGTSQR